MEELARIVAAAPKDLAVRVYFYEPAGASASWRQTDLWHSAASIPGVQVMADEEGRTAASFGAVTSGQALLYGKEGRLLFSGGLTDARGHSGESVGGQAILALLSKPQSQLVKTPVFGCSLISSTAANRTRGSE